MIETDFVYFSKKALSFPLNDSIKIADENSKKEFLALVSNSDEVSSQVTAFEIDFYLDNTQDDVYEQIKSVKTLYDARLISESEARYFDESQEVGKTVLVIGEEKADFIKKLKDDGFQAAGIKPENILYIEGHIGGFEVGILHEGVEGSVKTDQIIWQQKPEIVPLQSGMYELKNKAETIEALNSNSGVYNYKNFISYDANICQYHARREECCGKCAETCKSGAILKDETKRELVFSHIDCAGCGGCVSVCPSGALDFTQMPRGAFWEIAKLYKDKIALIIPRKMRDRLSSVKLPKNILPFAIEGEKYLHEAHLITLLQESGAQIVFYTDLISKGTADAISTLNQIYSAKYAKEAIFTAASENELRETLERADFIANSKYGINEEGLKKREIFSLRLSHIVGDEDFGVIKTGESVHYGVINIDKSKCTLCLSCVGACNVGALIAWEEDFTLRANSSICTTCRYCELTCPEKCIEIVRDEIPLNGEWFKTRIAARDEPALCAVCGKPYATKRSVEKIAALLKPIFAGDELKIKTLYCCADCKPKVMIEASIGARKS